MALPLPSESRVLIVGGGVIGCSLAYHLTRLGWKDVVVLEQSAVASGTTWHAAGLVGRLRTSNSLTKINKYSAELYPRLEQETGLSVGWKQVGSLILAKSEIRMTQLRRTAGMAAWFDVDVQLIRAEEARARWPLVQTSDIVGAAWLPHDGKCLPKELAQALARGAEMGGARIVSGVRVTNVLHHEGRATGVEVVDLRDDLRAVRTLKADFVVLCGGMWTRELGLRCGVTIPLYPVEHHWVLTTPIEGAHDDLPVARDPDLGLYFRGEGNRVMLGAFQAESTAWMVDTVPHEFSFQLLAPDWDKFSVPLANGRWRIPALKDCGFEKFTNGPESFTPDNNFIMGEAPELRNLFVGAGFNSVGIASAGGAGKYLAEWIIEGQPTLDLWSVDIRRFGPWANNRAYLRSRVVEVLGLHYQPAWPNREPDTARGARKSPLHDRMAAAGACFGVKNGWERPNWFARSTVPGPLSNSIQPGDLATMPAMDYSFERQNWFSNHALEHRSCRENAALFEQSGFGKLCVQGRDALTVLQRVCGNQIDVPVGRLVYTGLFNERGGFESDLTIVRCGREEFYLVTGTSQPVRDADWIQRHVRCGESVAITDVTTAYGVLGIMGPKARDWMSRTTDADLSNAAFPFGTARQISVGWATARALRVTYVGELGWELHVPVDQLTLAYDTLLEAGRDFGVALAGHYAINSLRLEKGFRAWGAEISPDDTPFEAGLAFAIDWNKEFVGREALLARQPSALTRQLAVFVARDTGPILWGSEPIFCDGQRVGYTTSGSYGHTVGGAIAMGYVNDPDGRATERIRGGRFEIEINGDRMAVAAHLRAPYDPERRRILC
ncbi:MAG: FAD-dependent oxidoreductase [Pedosphaera sp.]|nr:FAD-dependent oxidoreductase [Pedosphaera sp.]